MKASVLIADDDPRIRKALKDRFEHWGHAVWEARDGVEATELAGERVFDLVLLDLNMPRKPGLEVLRDLRAGGCESTIVVLTAHGSMDAAVEAMREGANDFLSKPADFDYLQAVVERILDGRQLERAHRALAEQQETPEAVSRTRSPVMRDVWDLAGRAAQADSTVLIEGESGTGKQVLSEFIHQSSPRNRGPFTYVNCVAISDELIESTLFGHEKGSFTGAVARKIGKLESAGGGTAFLDEIGDISSKLQVKLLHFLETGECERVGGTQTIRVDCRVVAATNRNLEEDVAEGRFRKDLFYRLNVITLRTPPLRERPEDIPDLAETFLDRLRRDLKRPGLQFPEATLGALSRYSWPGNIRQLKNVVERMAVLARTETLDVSLLPPEVERPRQIRGGDDLLDLSYREAIQETKRRMIAGALDRCRGNQTQAAEQLGLNRSYLNRAIKELGIGSGGD